MREGAPPFASAMSLASTALLASATLLAGCQVAPLYGTGSGAAPQGVVAVAPVQTRIAQQVRNALIEQLGRPSAPDPFTLTLQVSTLNSEFLRDPRTNRITRGEVTVTVRYTLADSSTTIADGTERASAQFDAPIQLFAQQRAVRDAEDRAARVAANRVRLAIAPTLASGRDALSVTTIDRQPPERDPE